MDAEKVWRARAAQVNAPYGGQDLWIIGNVAEGDIVYGGYPGQSEFFTDLETVMASKLNKATFSQSMQVAASPTLGYRPFVRAYRVKRNLRVPMGYTHANPHLGVGGSFQYYIETSTMS